MSYQALINRNIDKAFNLIKDLAVDIVLVTNSNEFDFSTGESTVTAESSLNLKAVVIDINKRSENHNYIHKYILFKSEDLIDITAYDTVLIENAIWKIGTRISNTSDFLYMIDIYKDRP